MSVDTLIDEYMTQEEVAAVYRVTPKTITNWVSNKKQGFPPGFKIGETRSAKRLWKTSEIRAHLEASAQTNAA